MELDQLRQLVEVERRGTISAAAESLHLTQPSLSRSMKRLEADLGRELFDRTRNRVELNEAGRLAVEHARDVLPQRSFIFWRCSVQEFALCCSGYCGIALRNWRRNHATSTLIPEHCSGDG